MGRNSADNVYPNIKRICKERKMKISDIEKKVGVSVGYLSRTIKTHGETSIGIGKVIAIADALEITIEELLAPPPAFTNADMFKTVFGIDRRCLVLFTDDWWGQEYKKETDDG